MTMTTTPTPTPEVKAEPRRYGRRPEFTRTDFAPLDRKADRSKNHRRGARKRTKRRVIL